MITYTCIRHWIDGGEKVPSQYTSVVCFFYNSRNFLRYIIDKEKEVNGSYELNNEISKKKKKKKDWRRYRYFKEN